MPGVNGSVIHTTGKMEFVDDLRTDVPFGGGWCHPGDCIKPDSLGEQDDPEGLVVVIWTPVRTKSNLLGSMNQWH